MFSHVTLGSNDLVTSKRFYDSLFRAVGGREGVEENGRLFYTHEGGLLVILKPIDGLAATRGNGSTIGFTMKSPDQAAGWHKAGIESGGTSIEDPPGFRERSNGQTYLAYLRDPDGNKLCAMYRRPGPGIEG